MTDRVELKQFEIEHIDFFSWRPDDFKTYNINSEFVTALLRAEKNGESYTAVYQGRILVIGGICGLSAKTGYAFTLFSKYADQAPFAAAKTVKRMFSRMVEDMDLHRVVTYNRIGAENHHRWCEWLGFKEECIARKFDDEGNDYVQYALVK